MKTFKTLLKWAVGVLLGLVLISAIGGISSVELAVLLVIVVVGVIVFKRIRRDGNNEPSVS